MKFLLIAFVALFLSACDYTERKANDFEGTYISVDGLQRVTFSDGNTIRQEYRRKSEPNFHEIPATQYWVIEGKAQYKSPDGIPLFFKKTPEGYLIDTFGEIFKEQK